MNKYEIIGIVGEGAYGIVYKAKNKDTGEFGKFNWLLICSEKDANVFCLLQLLLKSSKSQLRKIKLWKKLPKEKLKC